MQVYSNQYKIIVLPKIRSEAGKKSFAFQGAQNFNKPSEEITWASVIALVGQNPVSIKCSFNYQLSRIHASCIKFLPPTPKVRGEEDIIPGQYVQLCGCCQPRLNPAFKMD